MPAEQLSGTIVVIIIAIGVQGCIMLSIFAKRQIYRFALRNKRGPHTSIGQGGPKPLRREADRALDVIPSIRHEPRTAHSFNSSTPRGKNPEHFFRARALEQYGMFEMELAGYSQNYTRLPGSSVRSFLLRCTNGPLLGVDSHDIELLCDDYEHARHHFSDFGDEQLRVFNGRLNALREALEENKAVKPNPSPFLQRSDFNSPDKPGSSRRKRKAKEFERDTQVLPLQSRQRASLSEVIVDRHKNGQYDAV